MVGILADRPGAYDRQARSNAPTARLRNKASWQLRLITAFLVLVFLSGGGSRGDIAALMVLRPVSILVAMTGAMCLTRQQIRTYRWLFVIAVGCLALTVMQLVPLPPNVFYALPGRALIRQVDSVAGIAGNWRPMSLAPSATWNALWALGTPLAVLLLLVQLGDGERQRLLGVLLLLGLASALLGLLQICGAPRGPLYLYDITHNGLAVGLFANRNHQAACLVTLLPMLVVWAGTPGEGRSKLPRLGLSGRIIPALLAIICLIPLILITGSRAGLIAGGIAACTIPLLMTGAFANNPASHHPRSRWQQPRGLAAISAVVIAGLVALSIALGRALAWDRLRDTDPTGELRLRILPGVLHMIREFWPLGSGLGSFEPVSWIYEPDRLLMPLSMNHAHDDWLEAMLTGGATAILLTLLAVLAWVARALGVWRAGIARSTTTMPKLGLSITLLLGVASLSDYPLRTPALASLMVCAAVWASADVRPRGHGHCATTTQYRPSPSHT